ncbi:unnamed protein product [Schistosoma mattheei]|uniref:Uncharacterized protein n=1 Tax=Schistosoma mattheei TaxID=31246 RepID=A0A3P7YMA6_9TREM|nr:unnamed protein product [Schistosoma mattheei]
MLKKIKDSVDAQLQDQEAGFCRVCRVQTESQHYGTLWNNQFNRIHHSTSTSLTTRKHLTA